MRPTDTSQYVTTHVAYRGGSPWLRLEIFAESLRVLSKFVSGRMQWARQTRLAHASAKRMRVLETVALGEKRFAAVLQVDGMQFLIGGGAGNVSLLTTLPQPVAQTADASGAEHSAQRGETATSVGSDAAKCCGCGR